jgi:DNA gyrase subunit A
MDVSERNGKLVSSFPVEDSDQIMLVTDAGKLIRCPVDDIRIAGRATQGVTLFRLNEGERVVSVEHLGDSGQEQGDGE